jgi:hypothetical protein
MATRIKMTQGGYRIVETGKILPASDLIPFGASNNQFPGHEHSHGTFNEDNAPFAPENRHMDIDANNYANEMSAPFYELRIDTTRKFFPPRNLFSRKLSCAVISEGTIQLYVNNRK